MRHSLLLLAAPIVLLVGSACAPSAAPAASAAPPEQVTVTGADDFRFNPATVTVKAGQPLEVTFQNGGEILHDFTVQEGLAKPVMVLEDGGKSGATTVTYDSDLATFPSGVTTAAPQDGAAPLVYSAGYDARFGLVTSLIDANGNGI